MKPSINIPETAAGKQVQACLDIVNTCDRATLEEHITNLYEPSLLGNFPLFVQVAIHRMFYYLSAGLGYDFYGVQQDDGYNLNIHLRNRLTERLIGLELSVSCDKPHKIIKMLKHHVLEPSEQTLQATLLEEERAVARLDQCINRMAADEVFSGVVMLSKNNAPLYSQVCGMANRAFNIPNNENTKFNIASMGKMFTGIAVAKLKEAGELDFTDRISTYIPPEWLDADIAKQIQIRHLLTHTAGLGDYFPLIYQKHPMTYYRDLKDYQPLMQDVTLLFEPGTRWSYSNTGFLLLGVLIERITGESYFDFISKVIYAPAEMLDSGAFEADDVTPNLATGYSRIEAPGQVTWKNNRVKLILKGSPSGGSYATAVDMMRFDQALRNNVLLTPETTNSVLSAKPELHSPFYGYGFFVHNNASGTSVGHGGDGRGINCQFKSYHHQGTTLVALSNGDPPGANIISDVWDMLAARLANDPVQN